MNVLQLAWRNLLRNRRRTWASALTMAVGMAGVLLFGGYQRAVQYGLETAFVRKLGHLQVQHRDYLQYGSGNPAAYGIRDYRRIQREIESDPELKDMLAAVTPTLTLGAIAGHYASGTSRTVLAQGSEPEGQNRLLRWDARGLRQAAKPMALTGSDANAAVLGGGVAKTLGLCLSDGDRACAAAAAEGEGLPPDLAALTGPARAADGKRIELLTATAAGAPNVARLRVLGVERQGAREWDDVYVGLHLSQAQRLLYGEGEPMATAILLQLKSSGQIEAARRRLQQLFQAGLSAQPLAAHDFAALQPLYERIVDMFGAIFGFMAALIASVTLFTTGNTMNMAVMERTREIGALRSIGLRRGGVQRLFLCEGALLGVIGGLGGLLLSLGLAWLINRAGLSWLPPGVVDPSPILIRVWGETPLLASCMGGLMAVALSSSWWPSRRAARWNIVDALRQA
ncbi:ABC transporter permease [Chromobacterium rhizoryzae]|uniref:ABC transporter permease n=1 Tax=Chromobacterium rhizoryzae TaxID=1778675 RepID=UPI001D08320E|nr:FtsX-like permease family protein [Chromobacterium rhizoryzae]